MKKTVSIFIPAYNEEKNMKNLLSQILVQDQTNFVLEKILVVSDASIDKTVLETRSLKNPLIEIIENKERMGKWFGFTIAQKRLASDIIISLDADICITDTRLFEKISLALSYNDIVSVRQVPNDAITFFQKIMKVGADITRSCYEETGNSISLCNGRCIGMTKELFSNIYWQEVYGTDVYIYLQAILLHKKFKYIPESEVYYIPPKTILDYIKQSSRAYAVAKLMEEKLSIVYSRYTKPFSKKIFFLKTLNSLRVNFFTTLLYILVYLFTRPFCIIKKQKVLWSIATSTK